MKHQSFMSPFPIFILFISFSFLIAQAQTSRTTVSRRDKQAPYLAHDMKGNPSYSLLRTLFAIGLSLFDTISNLLKNSQKV